MGRPGQHTRAAPALDICKIKCGAAPAASVSELPAIISLCLRVVVVTFRLGPRFGEPYPDTHFTTRGGQTTSIRNRADILAAILDDTRKTVRRPPPSSTRSPGVLQTWSSSGLPRLSHRSRAAPNWSRHPCVETSVDGSLTEFRAISLRRLATRADPIVIGDRAEDRSSPRVHFEKPSRRRRRLSPSMSSPRPALQGNGHTPHA